jgi:hypothetical protein
MFSEQEKQGVPQRPQASAHLLVDSLDRYKTGYPDPNIGPTSSSSWSLNLNNYAMNGYFTRLSINQLQFFWNLPTIIKGYNDNLLLKNSVTDASCNVIIPQGYYGVTAMEDTLQSLINAGFGLPDISGNYQVEFDTTDGGFSIIAPTANQAFEIVSPTNDIQRRCLQTLGFTNTLLSSLAVFPAGLQILFGQPPTMLATRYIDIMSKTFSKYQRSKDTTTLPSQISTDIMARIYPVAPNTKNYITLNTIQLGPGEQPFIICIDYNNPKYISWSPSEAIPNFDLTLLDENGQILPWSKEPGFSFSCEYQLTMLASET